MYVFVFNFVHKEVMSLQSLFWGTWPLLRCGNRSKRQWLNWPPGPFPSAPKALDLNWDLQTNRLRKDPLVLAWGAKSWPMVFGHSSHSKSWILKCFLWVGEFITKTGIPNPKHPNLWSLISFHFGWCTAPKNNWGTILFQWHRPMTHSWGIQSSPNRKQMGKHVKSPFSVLELSPLTWQTCCNQSGTFRNQLA